MNNIPWAYWGWLVFVGLVLGLGLAWGASGWPLVLLAGIFLSLGYKWGQKVLRGAWDNERKIQSSLQELQQLTHSSERRIALSPSSDSLASELQEAVEDIKKRVANLEEEREKISAIVENLMEGVVAFDAQGQVLFTNSSAKNILGLSDQQVHGRSVWEVIRHKELAELVEECRDLALHDRRRMEVDIHAPTRMTLEVYGLPFPLANQTKGSVIVLHDVTQLRRLEQVRAEFIDNVSHELRTPLAAIIGYLETLIDEPSLETPNNRKFVHVAHQHAERLNRLVDDLRSLSEIESRKVVVRLEAVELKTLVDEVSEMFQAQAWKKGLQMTNQIEEGALVWADRDRVVQILLNLVDNAIKYSFEGGNISFLVQRSEKTLALQVKDSGQGIPSTDLSRITERFYRVDRARAREEGGTGLGLSIVKHLVQLLGGKLRIQSELGKGTTVDVELPISPQ